MHTPKILGNAFYRKTPVVAFEVSLVQEKNFKKRKLMDRLPLL